MTARVALVTSSGETFVESIDDAGEFLIWGFDDAPRNGRRLDRRGRALEAGCCGAARADRRPRGPRPCGRAARSVAVELRMSSGISATLQLHADRRPDRLAIECEGDRISWGELRERVSRTAGALAGVGVERGRRGRGSASQQPHLPRGDVRVLASRSGVHAAQLAARPRGAQLHHQPRADHPPAHGGGACGDGSRRRGAVLRAHRLDRSRPGRRLARARRAPRASATRSTSPSGSSATTWRG